MSVNQIEKQPGYDIRTKINLLEKTKGESNKYKCPVCGGSSLHIMHSAPGYKCYSNNCANADIRKAIDVLEGKPEWKPKPEWVKPVRAQGKTTYFYPDRAGKDLAKVDRIDRGDGKKDFYQSSTVDGIVWQKTMPEEIRLHLPIYNYADVQKAIKGNQKIWVCEGESAVEALRKIGLTATTTIGGSASFQNYGSYQHDLRGARLILCPDRDSKGVAYIAQWAEMFPEQIDSYYLAGTRGLWSNLADNGGMDIADAIADFGYSASDLIKQVVTAAEYKQIILPKVSQASTLKVASGSLPITDIERSQLSELLKLRQADNKAIDIYPEKLGQMLIRDAQRQNIDAASYTCYLLPAIASLMGHTSLSLGGGFDVPNIVWCVLIQPSGGGKSRAESLIKAPLFAWEREADISFKAKNDAYKKSLTNNKKGGSGFSDEIANKPIRRKYLMELATPQAVTKRLSESQDYGVAWFRDEIKGLFSSLGQFAKGDGEGTEILLQLWDGGGNVVDRVDIDESYVGARSRLSIAGGIQPAILSRVFDAEDPQGMFARFLPIIPQKLPAQLYKGELELKRELPALYHWIKSQNWEDLILDSEADAAFEEIYSYLGNMGNEVESIRAWQAKAAGQVGRVAISLHAIDCYYNGQVAIRAVSFDTLCRAYSFVLGCLDDVCRVAGTLSDTEKQSSLSMAMDKILQKAAKHPEGISIVDIYRNINMLRELAKKENRTAPDLAKSLCEELCILGHGKLEPSASGGFTFYAIES
jgi:Protein of unknown function (DUF3987)